MARKFKTNKPIPIIKNRFKSEKKFTPTDTIYTLFIIFVLGLLVQGGYSVVFKKSPSQVVLERTQATQVEAYEAYPPADPATLSVVEVVNDSRVNKLRSYLESKNSPLSEYSELIVEQADKYDIGWSKIVAISAIESNYGNKIKEGSHNAWGIIINGQVHSFDSWEDGIIYVSEMLSRKYKELEIEAIKDTYCPSEDCHGEWVNIVMASSEDILNK